LGADAGLPDALGYYLVWFIRGRYSRGPDFLSQFKNLIEWEKRVQSIGYGNPKDLGASEALEIAKAATPEDSEAAHPDPYEPTGLAPGDLAAVEPLDVNGCPAVTGRIVRITANEIALARTDRHVGNVVVHFPRAGYLVTKIQSFRKKLYLSPISTGTHPNVDGIIIVGLTGPMVLSSRNLGNQLACQPRN